MAARRRCTECRKTFTPARSAASTQCVCGAACRAARDRKLARIRRGRDRDGARAEEWARQQESRRRRLAAAGCHAPPSPRKCALLPEEVRQIVDRALAVSRATLVRDLRGILSRLAPIPGNAATLDGALSRATLGVQPADTMGESGEILAALSRVSLGDQCPT